jgi:hypothetical protein
MQNAHRVELEALMARAQAQCQKSGDGKMTLEHMVLALAENPRYDEPCGPLGTLVMRVSASRGRVY